MEPKQTFIIKTKPRIFNLAFLSQLFLKLGHKGVTV